MWNFVRVCVCVCMRGLYEFISFIELLSKLQATTFEVF